MVISGNADVYVLLLDNEEDQGAGDWVDQDQLVDCCVGDEVSDGDGGMEAVVDIIEQLMVMTC